MRQVRRYAAIAAVSVVAAASAQAADWGRNAPLPAQPGLYWQNCGGCHGSAGRFAPARLTVVDGTLKVKGSGTPLPGFLATHPVRLTTEETRALVETLTTVVTEGAAFQQRCAICHGEVEAFARTHLVSRNGQLLGRYSGRHIRTFLPGHARLDAEGGAFFLDVLKRFAASD